MSQDSFGSFLENMGLSMVRPTEDSGSRGEPGPSGEKRRVVEERTKYGALPGGPLPQGAWGFDGTERDWDRPQGSVPRGVWSFMYFPKSVHWAAVQLGYRCVRSQGTTRVECTEEEARELATKCAQGEMKRVGDRLAANLSGDSVPSEMDVRVERHAYAKAYNQVDDQDREIRRRR